MNSNQFFRNDLVEHKKKLYQNMNIISQEILERAFDHDNDKIINDIIFNTYMEHCQTQRSLEFGSQEYLDFIHTVMDEAITLHIVGNRHHIYNTKNPLTYDEATFIDYIEVLCDWIAAMGRYEMTQEAELARINKLMDIYKFPQDIRVPMINTYYRIKK